MADEVTNEGTILSGGTPAGDDGAPKQEEEKLAEGAEAQAGGQGEGAGEEGKSDQSKDGKDADKGKQGVPETYEAFTVPEGVTLDAAEVEAFTPIAKDLGLSQEQAQKLVDFEAQRRMKTVEAQTTEWNKTVDGWEEAAKQDKEYGGADFEANAGKCREVIEEFASPEFKKLLGRVDGGYGLGNHPEFVRFVSRIAKKMGGDTMERGRPTNTQSRKTQAERLFGSGEATT